MTKEEIIKHLHKALNFVDISFPYRYVFVEAIEALSKHPLPSNLDEAAEEHANRCYTRSASGERIAACKYDFKAGAEWMAQQGWISVDEKLPEMDEEVIVLTDELGTAPIYKISFGHIVDVERCIDYNGWNIPGVKYWMPCPEIPNNVKTKRR